MSSKLTYASLPMEIKKIANDSLGLGVLKSLFSYANTYHLMIKISDGAFIGFALYHFEESRMKDGSKYIVGIIDAVVVDTTYRKNGFGTTLTFGVLRKMSAYGADRVEIMLKSPSPLDRDGEPGIPLIGSHQTLELVGFKKVKTFNNHYDSISRKYGYDCNFCGNRPDTCRATLFSINA